MRLNAGQLVHRVTIQRLTGGVDDSGAPMDTPSTLCVAQMARKSLRASEDFKSEQLSASFLTEWTMGYRADMDPDLVDVPKSRRLLYQERTYDIVAAEVIDRRAGIILTTLAASRVAA